MSNTFLPWFGALDRFFYFAYGVFLTIGGNLILISLHIILPMAWVMVLALSLAGIPLIIGILTERAAFMRGFMLTVVLVVLGLAYFNRIEVPDPEPDRASAYASVWLEQLSSNPDEAFKVFHGPKDYKRWLPGRLAKVDKTKLKVDRVDTYAPQKQERRGACNNYDVWFVHPTGSARVSVDQCYDGGPEFEVQLASVSIESEVVGNKPKQD